MDQSLALWKEALGFRLEGFLWICQVESGPGNSASVSTLSGFQKMSVTCLPIHLETMNSVEGRMSIDESDCIKFDSPIKMGNCPFPLEMQGYTSLRFAVCTKTDATLSKLIEEWGITYGKCHELSMMTSFGTCRLIVSPVVD